MHSKYLHLVVYGLDTREHSPYGARAFGTDTAEGGDPQGCAFMVDQEPSPSFDELESRLRHAREREVRQPGRDPGGRKPPQGLALGMRLSVEFVAGVAVGAGIGWALDGWLGTRPWLMMVFLLLGGAAGVANAYRVARGMDATVGFGSAQRRKVMRSKDS